MKKDKRNTNRIKLDERFVSEVEGAVKQYYHAYVNENEVICGKEERRLKRQGKRDGKKGFPGYDKDGHTASNTIEIEKAAFNECCNEIWSLVQLQEEDNIRDMKRLLYRITKLEADLKKETEILTEKKNSVPDFMVRKLGDEALSDAQVINRRQGEFGRWLKVYEDKMEELKKEIMDCTLKADELLTEVTEKQNYTRLKCQMLFDHTRQRIDIYYRAALLKHPERAEMPLTVSVELIPEGEITYLAQHKDFLEEAKEKILYLQHTYDIVIGEELTSSDDAGISPVCEQARNDKRSQAQIYPVKREFPEDNGGLAHR